MWILPNYHCQFLNFETKGCTIYFNRLNINPECGDLQVIEESGGMPPMCNYHAEMTFKYKTKIASPKTEKRLWKKIKKLWKENGEPFSYDKERSHGGDKK